MPTEKLKEMGESCEKKEMFYYHEMVKSLIFNALIVLKDIKITFKNKY